jgi:hypothetical protein
MQLLPQGTSAPGDATPTTATASFALRLGGKYAPKNLNLLVNFWS